MDLSDVLWTMLAFFFWFMILWMFVAIFGDLFKRDDVSGWAKAGWIALFVLLPFIGLLIYVVARPASPEPVRGLMASHNGEQPRGGYSAADELMKLAQLRDKGVLSAAEYERMRSRTVMGV